MAIFSWRVPPSDCFWCSQGCYCFVAGVDAHHVVFVGLNRPFQLENFHRRRLPSRIPGGQGALIRVPSWQRIALAVIPLWWHLKHAFASSRCLSCQPSRFAFALARVALRRGVVVTPALSRQRLGFAPALLQRRLYSAPPPCLVICPGLQRLGFCSGGSLSPACKLDAGGTLGQGKCGVNDQ